MRSGVPGYIRAVADWNTLRWPLGVSALASMAIAGCGASAKSPPGNTLQGNAEKSLLTLVDRARTDVSARHAAAANAVLGEFVSQVSTLHGSGELSGAAAARLDRQVRASVTAIKRQLPASANGQNTTTTSSGTLVPPATGANGGAGDEAVPPIVVGGVHDPGTGAWHPHPGHDQTPGHGHPHGHGHGDGPGPMHGGGND